MAEEQEMDDLPQGPVENAWSIKVSGSACLKIDKRVT